MPKNFWKKINRPIFALAPMYEITNTCFRQIIAACGRPDIFFTEFISADGLTNTKSRKKLINLLLQFENIERPLVAQVWGSDPKKFYEAGLIIKKLGFNGIDINMGCPDKTVVKSGSGAALILNPHLAKKIIKETKKAGLPVSVKTRIGYDKKITKKWILVLLKAKPEAIIIHGRTKKEMVKVPADWEAIGEATKLAKGSGVLIIGNGDLKSYAEGLEKIKKYKLDGVMIGRAALTNPWIFNKKVDSTEISLKKRLNLILQYGQLFEKYFSGVNRYGPAAVTSSYPAMKAGYADPLRLKVGAASGIKNFIMVRRAICFFLSGFTGAKGLRIKLMAAKDLKELKKVIAGLK